MTEILFNKNGVVSLEAKSKEDDLKKECRFSINPPPGEGMCEVCGRHLSELKPFGGPGDPLVGDFTEKLLVKKWRRDAPYDKGAARAWEEAKQEAKELWKAKGRELGSEKPSEDYFFGWFIGKYGRAKGLKFYYWREFWVSSGSSWECRDCIVLDQNEYFAKKYNWDEEE